MVLKFSNILLMYRMRTVPYVLSFRGRVLILFHRVLSINVNSSTLSSSESLTISSERTLVSPGGVFELGFFKPSERSRWYLGICKRNGHHPPVIAELLPNGNFVLRLSDNNNDSSSGFLWQSFDYPTDTLLPGMKLGHDLKTGRNRFLTSWRADNDPSSGNFIFKIDIQRGLPEFLVMNQGFIWHRSSHWDGFIGIPGLLGSYNIDYNYTETSEEVTYRLVMTNQSIFSRLIMRDNWRLMLFTWAPPLWAWERSSFNYLSTELCDIYSVCVGPNTYCDQNTPSPSHYCNCITGFVPNNESEWRDRNLVSRPSGCVRKTPLNCGEYHNIGFLQLNNTNLPDTKTATVDRRIDVNTCRDKCLTDCNCTSFTFGNDGLGCVTWTGGIFDVRTYVESGHVLNIKLSLNDPAFSSSGVPAGKIIGWSIGAGVMLTLTLILFCFWKRRQKQGKAHATPIVSQLGNQLVVNELVLPTNHLHMSEEGRLEHSQLPLIEFEAVVTATEHFADKNKLGRGGFGVVYKGKLLDGQEIAVKRLSENSTQGTDEFMNEVRLISKLQHKNLVRLLGCCVNDAEKMLIYEYLENLSLDSHLFDESRSCMLNWQMRFDIINGIARGLLYLHQDSRFRIIHRDLKASNVLLDKDMTPKIADFGMARIFGRDETEANTRKVVGTYGYMSPEYAMNGTFSMKSDVFSFGVLLLEVISGKRNRGFCDSDSSLNLLGYVWRKWIQGQGLEIVDNTSPTSRPREEILRCLQIGLLCVQERVEDRPMMSSVVLMLGSEAVLIPQPKQPGYCVGSCGSSLDTYSSTWIKRHDDEFGTVNQITMSIIDAR
ncbi:unnamed protein product [Eruca vesicaria subsp. sativa]|uniref:Receptor-like serine/threonine-protein kinase n=1 Tax=Eruca vesicaria subsp. sativa TaxID=29727 RepID=A0ABC8L7M8_ERUVS|nr:unnamed protein product [Eruca vesicaria subsp. sativa]